MQEHQYQQQQTCRRAHGLAGRAGADTDADTCNTLTRSWGMLLRAFMAFAWTPVHKWQAEAAQETRQGVTRYGFAVYAFTAK
jgi:hypothetical protein